MPKKRKPIIAVCGASGSIDQALQALAMELGCEIARADCNVVCGGLNGVMEAVCRGYAAERDRARSDGMVIGLLPGTNHQDANDHVDIALPTGIGLARNSLVALAGDGVVLCGGGTGTLSEAAYAWQFGRPVAALVSSGGWAAELSGKVLDHRHSRPIYAAKTPADAIAWLRSVMKT